MAYIYYRALCESQFPEIKHKRDVNRQGGKQLHVTDCIQGRGTAKHASGVKRAPSGTKVLPTQGTPTVFALILLYKCITNTSMLSTALKYFWVM